MCIATAEKLLREYIRVSVSPACILSKFDSGYGCHCVVILFFLQRTVIVRAPRAAEASPINGGKPEPIVYVAVIDSVGNFVYRIPASEVGSIWPGLGRTAANATVQAAPAKRVDSVNPGVTPYAMTFTSNCQATNWTAARAQNCGFNGNQG